MRTVEPVPRGELMEGKFLKPLGLIMCRLGKDIGVPTQQIGEIVAS